MRDHSNIGNYDCRRTRRTTSSDIVTTIWVTGIIAATLFALGIIVWGIATTRSVHQPAQVEQTQQQP